MLRSLMFEALVLKAVCQKDKLVNTHFLEFSVFLWSSILSFSCLNECMNTFFSSKENMSIMMRGWAVYTCFSTIAFLLLLFNFV